MINDRQFFITKEKTSAFSDWKTLVLSYGYTLHYHEGLNIVYHCESIILMGYAWQVDPARKSPQEELETLRLSGDITHQDVYDIEKSWCGRYILIVNDYIYLDASGTLGVFFSDKTISSSLNVLCTIENREFVYPEITHGKMPDFFPGMRTPYDGVLRLLPSQVLNYVNNERIIRPLLVDEPPVFDSEKERILCFARYFVHCIQNFSKVFHDHTLWLALTGGRDSRTSLACFEKAGINYKTFTLWHEHISRPDFIFPPKLAEIVHREHRHILRDQSQYSQQRYDDYKTHTAGMAVDEDWNFYAFNQYQALREENEQIVIIRGSVWGIPNHYYKSCLGDRADDLTVVFPGILNNELFYRSTKEWKDFIKTDELNQSISFENRTLWELREGCWLASIEQSFDMMDGITSIQIANSRLLLSLLFSFSSDERIKKIHEEKITSAICPEFAKIPYDYQYETFSQKIHRYKKVVKRIMKKIIGKE